MRCRDCKHFKRLKDGVRGAIFGCCCIHNTHSWHDYRYGRQKACKRYFESYKAESEE